METSRLPSPRTRPTASLVDNIIFVTGGADQYMSDLTAILSWDPSTQSWREAGNLAVGRDDHAAVAVPSIILESECSALLSI